MSERVNRHNRISRHKTHNTIIFVDISSVILLSYVFVIYICVCVLIGFAQLRLISIYVIPRIYPKEENKFNGSGFQTISMPLAENQMYTNINNHNSEQIINKPNFNQKDNYVCFIDERVSRS